MCSVQAVRVNAINEQLAFLYYIKWYRERKRKEKDSAAKVKLMSLILSAFTTILRRKSALTSSKSKRYVTVHKVAPRCSRFIRK